MLNRDREKTVLFSLFEILLFYEGKSLKVHVVLTVY